MVGAGVPAVGRIAGVVGEATVVAAAAVGLVREVDLRFADLVADAVAVDRARMVVKGVPVDPQSGKVAPVMGNSTTEVTVVVLVAVAAKETVLRTMRLAINGIEVAVHHPLTDSFAFFGNEFAWKPMTLEIVCCTETSPTGNGVLTLAS